jgi:putative glutamine amidotransferase
MSGSRGPAERVVVGVTTSVDPGVRLRAGEAYVYLKRSYGRAVRAAGGLPVLLPPELEPGEAAGLCDAIVLTGGEDLPARLPEDGSLPAPSAPGSQPELSERVAWDRALLDACLAAGTPLLGVCYGMQLLNLHLGGTLIEDLAASRPEGIDHGGGGRFTEHALSRRAAHPALASLPEPALVSSSHRQAVDRVAPGLDLLAEAPDGVVEAIGRGALLGVEWHPESDASAPAVYGWLVQQGGRRRSRRVPSARRLPGGRPR